MFVPWTQDGIEIALAAGAAGGSCGATYQALEALVYHQAVGSFKRSYLWWYWSRPILGALMGIGAALLALATLKEGFLSDRTAILFLAFGSGLATHAFSKRLRDAVESFLDRGKKE